MSAPTPGELLWNYYTAECAKYPTLAPRRPWAEVSAETRAAWERTAEKSPNAARLVAINAASFNASPPMKDEHYSPSRLRARRTLPGDMHANWREGYWVGIFAGMIIGAALMALYLWSQR